MPLNFGGASPWVVGRCVLILGRSGQEEILCKTNIETMWDMGAETADPLLFFQEKRHLFEGIFSKLWDLGIKDEQGEISFWTKPFGSPAVSS